MQNSWVSDCCTSNLSCEGNGKSSIGLSRVYISPLDIVNPARRIHSIHSTAPTYFNSLPNISKMQTVKEHFFIVRKAHGA